MSADGLSGSKVVNLDAPKLWGKGVRPADPKPVMQELLGQMLFAKHEQAARAANVVGTGIAWPAAALVPSVIAAHPAAVASAKARGTQVRFTLPSLFPVHDLVFDGPDSTFTRRGEVTIIARPDESGDKIIAGFPKPSNWRFTQQLNTGELGNEVPVVVEVDERRK